MQHSVEADGEKMHCDVCSPAEINQNILIEMSQMVTDDAHPNILTQW